MAVGEGFEVEPDDLKKAGDEATQIGDRMHRASGDLSATARAVSGGLDGFALVGAFHGCAQAWEDELGSMAHKARDAGGKLCDTAGDYEGADVAARDGLGAIADALGQSGS